MPLQLTAQNGNDGGDLGQGQAWLVEEEYELGYQLCPVRHFSVPGSFPGEPRRDAVKAFTGMNQISVFLLKRFSKLGLFLGPLTPVFSWQLVKMPSDTHQVMCLPSVRVAGACAACPFQSPETAFEDKPNY